MRNFIIYTFLFITSYAFGQFNIKGKVTGYENQKLKVKLYTQTKPKIVNQVKTNSNGEFNAKIPIAYHGMIQLETTNGELLELLTDNNDISLEAEVINNQLIANNISKGKVAKTQKSYNDYLNKSKVLADVFSYIKTVYQPEDSFYKQLSQEENRVKDLAASIDLQSLPLLNYYAKQSQFLEDIKQSAQINNPNVSYKDSIQFRLNNQGEMLEQTGMLGKMILAYFDLSLAGAQNQEEFIKRVKSTANELVGLTDLTTSRGQNIVTSIINILPKTNYPEVVDGLYAKVKSLDCKKTDELQSLINASKVVVGGKAPNFKFNTPQNGAKDLYGVKADQKLLVFWASWCPACQQEMPFIKEYYPNFKKEGGEVIAISLDFNEQDYKNAIADFDFINHSDLLKWEGPTSALFGINATPTLMLLDKNNNILKIGEKLTDVLEFEL